MRHCAQHGSPHTLLMPTTTSNTPSHSPLPAGAARRRAGSPGGTAGPLAEWRTASALGGGTQQPVKGQEKGSAEAEQVVMGIFGMRRMRCASSVGDQQGNVVAEPTKRCLTAARDPRSPRAISAACCPAAAAAACCACCSPPPASAAAGAAGGPCPKNRGSLPSTQCVSAAAGAWLPPPSAMSSSADPATAAPAASTAPCC